ncbi:MAG: TetR/AcrR family transcriptional regulator [Acidimicrobiales bacterium]|nr:TetR/AcrR family transcriptional regulator [Acidimicrobiales bacterium]
MTDVTAARRSNRSAPPLTVDGRIPGKRGLATRQRLLDVTSAMLQSTAYRDLAVVDIAREAGVSPATFYQYFADVEAAILVLAEDLADEGADLLAALVEQSRGPVDLEVVTRDIAAGFVRLWDDNRAVLRVIDLGAGEGDARFRELRTRLLAGPTGALAQVLAERGGRGEGPAGQPQVAAAVLTSMLAHVAAHRQGLEDWGAPADELTDAMARVLTWALGEDDRARLRQLGSGTAGTAKAS